MYEMLRSLVPLLALIAAVVSTSPSATSAETLSVTGVRIGEHTDKTRFVLDISRQADYTLLLLPNPYRLVIDMPEFAWKADNGSEGAGGGLISGFRYGLFQPGQSRLVLDLKAPVEVRNAFIIPPRGGHSFRLVIDLAKTDREKFLAGINRPKPVEKPANGAVKPTLKPEDNGRPIIVIDPGHGGVDPGTISGSGRYEKHVTLSTSMELKRRLDATGRYRVFLTRDKDISVGLRDRVQRARAHSADLFVSIHADSIADRNVRGATIYTLSETASDREAAELAAKENKADVILGIDLGRETEDVTSILIDLAQRETMNFSARFATLLAPEIGKRMVLRRNSHRFAGFAVLKAPDVPSVLVELGYLSNPEDERFLSSASGRSAISDAIMRATESYFAQRLTMGTP